MTKQEEQKNTQDPKIEAEDQTQNPTPQEAIKNEEETKIKAPQEEVAKAEEETKIEAAEDAATTAEPTPKDKATTSKSTPEKETKSQKKKNKGISKEDYNAFIKDSVDDKSYFKDALDWYLFRYVTPICYRTLLIFGAMIASVVLYALVQLFEQSFPLVEEKPIFIKAKDQSLYFPELVELKPKKGSKDFDPNIQTVDESVAKYLLSNYVKEREGYDFSESEIIDVNNKINRIRNTSSAKEYKDFQKIMSKDNPQSPIRHFGKKVKKIIAINSVTFIRKEPEKFTLKAKEFLFQKIPNEAHVRFSATISKAQADGTYKNEKKLYLAKIIFAFDGVNKNKETKKVLNFSVNDYRLFKIGN